MRGHWLLVLLVFIMGSPAFAAEGRVIKVLPHYLDAKGRNTLYPSLYERDAYQALLRSSPALRESIRFDVQWKGRHLVQPRLRVETRSGKGDQPKSQTIEKDVRGGGWFSKWSELLVAGDEFQQMGELIAWRVTLLDGTRVVHQQISFLWQEERPGNPPPPASP